MSLIYIRSLVPTLDFDFKPDIHSDELFDLLKFNLSKFQYSVIKRLRFFYDIKNLLVESSLEGVSDNRANYSGAKIIEMFEDQEGIDPLLNEYLEEFTSADARISNISNLYFRYFKEGNKISCRFFKAILLFEHNLSLLITAFRAKRMDADLKNVLLQEQEMTEMAQLLIANQGATQFVFPPGFKDLETRLTESKKGVKSQFLAEARFRFDVYNKEIERSPLSFNGILAYLMSLWILEDIHSLDRDEGKKIINAIVENDDE